MKGYKKKKTTYCVDRFADLDVSSAYPSAGFTVSSTADPRTTSSSRLIGDLLAGPRARPRVGLTAFLLEGLTVCRLAGLSTYPPCLSA